MYYATHCVGPVLALQKNEAEYVSCFGSGRIDPNLAAKYGSPFAIETCHIKFKNSDLCAEVTRSLFNTARQYRESFDVYGSKRSFEWSLIEHEDNVIHTGESPSRIKLRIIRIYCHRRSDILPQVAFMIRKITSMFLLFRAPAMAARILTS